MPSDKAIEAAIERVVDVCDITPAEMKAAITVAYAIDGDFNAGVEAAAKHIDELNLWFTSSPQLAAEIRKLKR